MRFDMAELASAGSLRSHSGKLKSAEDGDGEPIENEDSADQKEANSVDANFTMPEISTSAMNGKAAESIANAAQSGAESTTAAADTNAGTASQTDSTSAQQTLNSTGIPIPNFQIASNQLQNAGSASASENAESKKIAGSREVSGGESDQADGLGEEAFAARLKPLSGGQAHTAQREDAQPVAHKQETDSHSGTSSETSHSKTGSFNKNDKGEEAQSSFQATAASLDNREAPVVTPASQSASTASSADRSSQTEQTPGTPNSLDNLQETGRPGDADGTRSTSARNIEIQLNQGDQRVNVRLSERGGEVHVSVRTQDAQLAGALRQDLPSLSGKLEQSGFRAETWHPAAPHTAEHSPSQSAGSNQSRDEQNQPRQGGQQQQQEPRRPKPEVVQSTTDSKKVKDFQWFMSQQR
jgi:hypothetical protein